MRISAVKLIRYQIFLYFIFAFFSMYMSLSRGILMIGDVINILLAILFLKSQNTYTGLQKEVRNYICYIAIWIVYSCFTYNIGKTSNPVLLIWGIRYYVRYYFFFLACVIFINKHRAEKVLDFLLEKLYPINFVFAMYQYFTIRIGDLVVGILNSNAFLNIYLCISLIYSLKKYNEGKRKVWYVLYQLIIFTIICSIAEIKIAILELVLVLLLFLIFSGRISKKLRILFIGIVGIIIGYSFLSIFFPNMIKYFTNWDKFVWYTKEMRYGNDNALAINRLSAFTDINATIFRHSPISQLFGVGIGNGNKIKFLNIYSNVYSQYAVMCYDWFTHALVFVEGGYLGVILYYAFPISLLFKYFKMWKSKDNESKNLATFELIFLVLLLVNSVYNIALLSEESGAYLIYFTLALPLLKKLD